MDQEAKKQLYEMAFLANPSMLEEEAKDFHQKTKNQALGFGALIEDEGRIEKIRLSYPIKKQLEANLGSFKFILDPAKIDELNSKIKAENQILRVLCLKTIKPPQRQISTKPFRPTSFTEIKPAQGWSTSGGKEEPAVSIEEIDKKLEEILGK